MNANTVLLDDYYSNTIERKLIKNKLEKNKLQRINTSMHL